MKPFKKTDVFLQTGLLILICTSFIAGDTDLVNPLAFIIALALVQVISIVIHLIAGKRKWKKSTWRKIHHTGTLLVLGALLIALMQDTAGHTGSKEDKYAIPGLETAIYATIPAILLSLFYVVISWAEWRKLK